MVTKLTLSFCSLVPAEWRTEDILVFTMSAGAGAVLGLAAGLIGVKRMRGRMQNLESWKLEMEAKGEMGERINCSNTMLRHPKTIFLYFWSAIGGRSLSHLVHTYPNNPGILLDMRLTKCLRMVPSCRFDIYCYAAKRCGLSKTADPKDAIKYHGEDLVLEIFFPKNELCARFVDDVYRSLPTSLGHDSVSYKKCEHRVPRDGVEIERMHYDADESGSPSQSVVSAVSSCTVSYALASSDEAAYQMFEDRAKLAMLTFHNCHMVDAKKCVQVGLCSATEKNNMLCCTPNTHSMLDAVTGACPTLRIEPLGIDEADTMLDSKNRKRVRVNIRVHFRDLSYAHDSGIKFREGSVKVSPCAYDTFVHMVKPNLFMSCAAWKNQDTVDAWV